MPAGWDYVIWVACVRRVVNPLHDSWDRKGSWDRSAWTMNEIWSRTVYEEIPTITWC
jgi:hypothetical protein